MENNVVEMSLRQAIELIENEIKLNKETLESAKSYGSENTIGFFEGTIKAKEHCVNMMKIALGGELNYESH